MANLHLGLSGDQIEYCATCGQEIRQPDTPPSAVSSPPLRSSTSDGHSTTSASSAPENELRTGPQRAEMYNSDNGEASPWAPKVLLCLDGGGIRGYSSLLILKKLTETIRMLETGSGSAHQAHGDSNSDGVQTRSQTTLDVCTSSACYPWHCNSDSIPGYICAGTNCNTFKLRHYFDYMAGTSTGGLSAIMLSRLGMSVDEALEQYAIVGNGVFGRPRSIYSSWNGVRRPKYRSHDMVKALKKVIDNADPQAYGPARTDGGELLLRNKNPHACRTIVLSYGSDEHRVGVTTYMFRSYNHLRPTNEEGSFPSEHLNYGEASRAKLWEVARATSAAPSYFAPAMIGRFVHQDGGLGANNPTERAFTECQQMHQGKAPFIVISVGAGLKKYTPQNLPPRGVAAILQQPNNLWDAFQAVENFATDCEATHRQIRAQVHSMKSHKETPSDHAPYYYRFNADDIKDIALDEWIPADSGEVTKRRLESATATFLEKEEVKKDILECATRLVQLRRRRAKTERWERFATSVVYACPEPACNLDGFDNARNDLRTHGRTTHGKVLRERLPLMCLDAGCHRRKLVGNEEESLILDHLRQDHGFEHPNLVTATELEAWLDRGRTSPHQAAQDRANRQGQNDDAQARAVGNLHLETPGRA